MQCPTDTACPDVLQKYLAMMTVKLQINCIALDFRCVIKDSSESDVSTPATLANYYTICEPEEKLSSLVGFLKSQGSHQKYMIFLSTCACVDYFATVLQMFVDSHDHLLGN